MKDPAPIALEQAPILAREAFADGQVVLRLHAPACAARALPGNFVHLRCDALLPLRRPLSLMRADPEAGWIEILFKVVGRGTALLAAKEVGEAIDLLGPIGHPFIPHPERPRPLLVGGGVGIPPLVFLSQHLRRDSLYLPLALFGSESPFPFQPRPSNILVPAMPAGVIACLPLLDDWGIPSRLASGQGFPGCHPGRVTELARLWLEGLDAPARRQVEIFACGPHPMLEAVAALAREFAVPAQVSLEEFMACGVGGCAGCTVRVETAQGPAMRRVCVDGPVFAAETVFP